MHHDAKSPLIILDRTIHQDNYIDILRDTMVPFARQTFMDNYVFVQDNAALHVARRTMDYLRTEGVEVMEWPARSPDMNRIEHVWDQMGVILRDMDNPPTTLAELRVALLQAWDRVTIHRVAHLIESMPRRVTTLRRIRGGNTRY